jgi:hypothetical protein
LSEIATHKPEKTVSETIVRLPTRGDGMTRSALASLFVIGLSIATAHSQETPGVTNTEVRVGSFGPFEGPAFLFGKIAMNGFDVVFGKVNAEGGCREAHID